MNRHFFSGPSGRRIPFVPRLEVLENRTVPCTVSDPAPGGINGGFVVEVTGDNGNDTVVIDDDGTDHVGNMAVTCNGGVHSWPHIANITEIRVRTGRGHDDVTYNLNGRNSLIVGGRKIDVLLGKGDDVFRGNVAADLPGGVNWVLYAHGEKGADSIQVNARNVDGNDVDIAVDASLVLDLGGGNGDDTVKANYGGDLDGRLFLWAGGGKGEDRLRGTMQLDEGSEGNVAGTSDPGVGSLDVAARVRGNKGDDRLRLVVHNLGAAAVFARIEGGKTGEGQGFDRGTRTTNVTADHIDVDNVVT